MLENKWLTNRINSWTDRISSKNGEKANEHCISLQYFSFISIGFSYACAPFALIKAWNVRQTLIFTTASKNAIKTTEKCCKKRRAQQNYLPFQDERHVLHCAGKKYSLRKHLTFAGVDFCARKKHATWSYSFDKNEFDVWNKKGLFFAEQSDKKNAIFLALSMFRATIARNRFSLLCN